MLVRVLAVAGLLVALLGVSAGATVADGWNVPASVVATEQYVATAQVAVDARGRAIVVWVANDGAHEMVRARRIGVDGALGPTLEISSPSEIVDTPRVAVRPSGAAIVTWSGYRVDANGGASAVQARRIADDDALGPIVDVAANTRNAFFPDLGLDRAGRATVAWMQETECHEETDGDVTSQLCSYVVRTRRIAADDVLGPAVDLSVPFVRDAPEPQARVGVAPAGQAFAVWQGESYANRQVQARTIAGGGALGPNRGLSVVGLGLNAGEPEVAVDGAGRATVTWVREGAGGGRLLEARRIAPDSSRGPILTLFSDHGASSPHVAVDRSGQADVTWETGSGAIAVRRIAADDRLGPIVALSSGPGDFAPQLGVDDAGRAIVSWIHAQPGTGSPVVEARRVVGGSPGALVPLTDAGALLNAGAPQVALDARGDATVVWAQQVQRSGPQAFAVAAAAFLLSPTCRDAGAVVRAATTSTLALPCRGLRLTREVLAGPAHGTLGTVDPVTGGVAYTPTPGWCGRDTVRFGATNAGGSSQAATLTIRVAGRRGEHLCRRR